MSSLQAIEDVRSRHKVLYDKLLQDQSNGHKLFSDPPKRDEFEARRG